MANTRKFDEEKVLDGILSTFWRKGYEATSLEELTQATGLGRQSLYNAYGNKQQMFDAALDRYQQRLAEVMRKAVCHKDASLKQKITAIFEALTSITTNPDNPGGCFVVNTAVEFGCASENSITDRIKTIHLGFEAGIRDILLHAQQKGDFPADRDPTATARFLMASVMSIAVLYRLHRDPTLADSILSEALRVL